jgi:hypothetical protein
MAAAMEIYVRAPGRAPDLGDIFAVRQGYLYVLHIGAEKKFGKKAAFTKAIKGWYDACLEGEE